MTDQSAWFDLAVLSDYLSQHVAGFEGPIKAEKFDQGQSNPTFLIRAVSGKYVLRAKPLGVLLASAHAVDREYKVIRALAATAVPVPVAHHLCEDSSVIGSAFYVMSFEAGTVYSDPALPAVDSKQARRAMSESLLRGLAAIHNVDVAAVGLADYGKTGNYFQRQLNRWTKQYRSSATDRVESMEALLRWLPENMPAADGQVCLTHGDYRLGNVMFQDGGTELAAVLDWELSTLGHPLSDLAYFCMYDVRMPALADDERHALGLLDEVEIVQQYGNLRGLAGIDNWHFYLAFSHFRLAAIAQGVYKRTLDGNASNKSAIEADAMVRQLSQQALTIIQQAEG